MPRLRPRPEARRLAPRPGLLPALLLPALLLAALLTAPAAQAQFTFEPDDIVVGVPVTVTLPPGTDTLTVVYRPNSSIGSTEHVPVGGAAAYTWTPAQPGIVRLATEDGAGQNVSVRFQSPPASGIVVLVLAGCILFGGAIFATRALFQRES